MLNCTRTLRIPLPEFEAAPTTLNKTVDSALADCVRDVIGQAAEIGGQISNFDTHVNFLASDGAYLVTTTLTATTIYKEKATENEPKGVQRNAGGRELAATTTLPAEVESVVAAIRAEYQAKKAKSSECSANKNRSKSQQTFKVGPDPAREANEEKEGEAEKLLPSNSDTRQSPSVRGLFDD